MYSVASILFLLNSALALLGASLIKTPNNKVVVSGQRMKMECRTDNGSIFRKWDFLQVGSESPRMIAINDNTDIAIVPNISRFGVYVDHNGSVVLYSNSTKTTDAGVYICQGEKGSTEFKYSAQLIVLESEPICETNLIANATVSDGDYRPIWMKCRVNFRGNWAPTMEWRQQQVNADNHEGRLVSNETVTVDIQKSNITSTLVVLIDSTNYDSYFSCRTYFTWHNGRLRTNASNVPNFSHTWISNSTSNLIVWPTTSADSTTASGNIALDKILLYMFLALVFVAIVGLFACHRTRAIRKVYVVSRGTSMSKSDSLARQIAQIIRPRIRNSRSTANSMAYSEIDNLNTIDAKISLRERLALPLPAPHSVHFHRQPISTSPASYERLHCRIERENRPENSDTRHHPTTCREVSVTVHSEDVETSASQVTCSGASVDLQKAFDSVENRSCVKAEIVYTEVRKGRLVTLPSVSSDEEMPSSYLVISDPQGDPSSKISIYSI